MTYVDELRVFVRFLQRMKPELYKSASWLHIEAACSELRRAITMLMRGK